jgi:hypothetical protein
MNYKIFVAFMLIGFECDPEEITARVGITPTETWRTGDFVTKKAVMKHKSNGWQLDSKLEQTAELEDHIKSVLEQLKPSWQSLIEISIDCYVEISCAIHLYSDNQLPAIHFNKEMVQEFAELNTDIDIDLYNLTTDEED